MKLILRETKYVVQHNIEHLQKTLQKKFDVSYETTKKSERFSFNLKVCKLI